LLSRDIRSIFLALELKSMTILAPLSMATETEQCRVCFTCPLVVLVKGLLRSDHLNKWLIAKTSLSHSLYLLDEILSRTACSFLASVLGLSNKTWIQLLKPSPKMPFNYSSVKKRPV